MVLVYGLLVILDIRRFFSVKMRRRVGPCTMGESRLTSWVDISRQVSRWDTDTEGRSMVKSKDTPPQKVYLYLVPMPNVPLELARAS